VAVGDDEARLGGRKGGRFEERRQRFRHGPEKGVAEVAIVVPFPVPEEVGAGDLHFREPDVPARVHPDHVGAAAVAEPDLANAGEAV
jgi:hypothetical protein